MAAVSLATPVFLLSMTFGMVFGVGGTSVISRALGERKHDYARKARSFCVWCCVGVGILLAAAMILFVNPILSLIGASADTWEPAKNYLTLVVLGTPFIMISNCFSNILRAEGQPGKAMVGTMLGNIINIILDPIMILGFSWDIKGAAIATVIGNIIGAGYYMFYYISGKSSLSIRPKDFSAKGAAA